MDNPNNKVAVLSGKARLDIARLRGEKAIKNENKAAFSVSNKRLQK